ncbi:hypothetical protein CO112_00880 [Candidatus Dojkabacteria bacterium CG_4_9_14_3_um_filter_150_Dojkabacteria_WS6_41_13]|nr:MAG: hypothetical protein CO112_00880 [Candidatus Dojkabacteria bacterium CG_4_9_14_3_um_filter_150_Dojkabacteria_WS6_41_13]
MLSTVSNVTGMTRKAVNRRFFYEYYLLRQPRRTMNLTVMPNLRIVLKCPALAEESKIQNFLQRKWFWLEKQLSFFKKYKRKRYDKEYVSGEGFLYLGRQYKLQVTKGLCDKVTLSKNRLTISTTNDVSEGGYNKKLLESWYESKRNNVFSSRFSVALKKFEYKQRPELSIGVMSKRWGSFYSKEKIFLNPKLIHASKECIDYVITHELCHLTFKKHDKHFYHLMREKYPK